jgi:hypothetical protein
LLASFEVALVGFPVDGLAGLGVRLVVAGRVELPAGASSSRGAPEALEAVLEVTIPEVEDVVMSALAKAGVEVGEDANTDCTE